MKKLFVTLTIILTLCSANLSHAADRYVMLKIGGGTASASQSVAAGEVATLMWASYVGNASSTVAKVNVTYGGITKQLFMTDDNGGTIIHGPDLSRFVIPGPGT